MLLHLSACPIEGWEEKTTREQKYWAKILSGPCLCNLCMSSNCCHRFAMYGRSRGKHKQFGDFLKQACQHANQLGAAHGNPDLNPVRGGGKKKAAQFLDLCSVCFSWAALRH